MTTKKKKGVAGTLLHDLPPPLVLRLSPVVQLSADQFLELCSLNGDLRLERTTQGELVVMPPAGGSSSRGNLRLAAPFGLWVEMDGTGVGFDSSGGFVLPNGAIRSPDLAWVTKARWDTLSSAQQDRFPPLCPDFVLELRSPSDPLRYLQAKMEEYMANGAQLGWLIDPIQQRAYVYRPGAKIEVLDRPESLSGDPVLPGLVLNLLSVWDR